MIEEGEAKIEIVTITPEKRGMKVILEKSERSYSEDVTFIEKEGREFIIIGTAHISKESAELVKEVIESEKPDMVCIELDKQRYEALSQKKKWENLDLKTLIKQKQLATLLVNILLASYQKRMGEKLGVMPGVELLEAARVAKDNNLPIELCDRDVRITLKRAWNSLSAWHKMKFVSFAFAGLFEKQEISEEQLREMRKKDTVTELMNELGKEIPMLKKVVIDERDDYLAKKISECKGTKVVAVVGAGHVTGIIEAIRSGKEIDLEKMEVIPPVSPLWKIIGWGIPVIIIGSIIYIGYSQGAGAAQDNALFWILANGIPSALGVVIALGHPLTVLTAFLAAPITSLTPLIGAGYVAAFVQAYIKPPVVKEFQSIGTDIAHLKEWWRNKLLRVMLVFILSGLGSAVGTYVGAYEIIGNLLK
jgi:pheromone shutdown-related protein TraB